MSADNLHTNLSQAHALLERLRGDFLAELPEKIDRYESLVLALEDAARCNESFEALYRGVHSLKGSAGTHGLATITAICHQFEDTLNELGHGNCATPELTVVLLQFLDLIRRTIDIAGQGSPNYAEIDQAIHQIRQRQRKGKILGLIVEDKAYMRNIILSSLSDPRLEVTFIKDGLEALNRLLRTHYDFLITGAEIRSLNGTALLYALRAAGGINRHIRVIMVTSKDNPAFAADLAPDYLIHKDRHIAEQMHEAIASIIATQ